MLMQLLLVLVLRRATLLDQRAPLPMMSNPKHDLMNRLKEACASNMDQSTNGAHINLKMEDCASGTGRRT